jgi:hypothetical protein
MQECKPIRIPIRIGVKLFVDKCPKTHEDK